MNAPKAPLFAFTLTRRDAAQRLLHELRALEREGALNIARTATVRRDEAGRIVMEQGGRPLLRSSLLGAGVGALVGSVVLQPILGALLGGIFAGSASLVKSVRADDDLVGRHAASLPKGQFGLFFRAVIVRPQLLRTRIRPMLQSERERSDAQSGTFQLLEAGSYESSTGFEAEEGRARR